MSRLDGILERLERGPASAVELMLAGGYRRSDGPGRNYVYVAVARLRRRGHSIHVLGKPGSHRGCTYVLRRSVPATCPRCGGWLARDNRGALCSPCQRSMVDAQLLAVTA